MVTRVLFSSARGLGRKRGMSEREREARQGKPWNTAFLASCAGRIISIDFAPSLVNIDIGVGL